MSILSSAQREGLWAAYMSDASASRQDIPLTKDDLRAAVDAVDRWIDDNAASFNQALPETARTNLTATQKAELLVLVARKRFEAR